MSASAWSNAVRREQIGDRPGEHDDVLRGFLDLPHALEIGDRRADELDADAEQRRHRDAEQLGELLQRLDLGELALLEAIERGAGNIEPGGDLVGAQPRAEPEGLEAVTDVVEADRHAQDRIAAGPHLIGGGIANRRSSCSAVSGWAMVAEGDAVDHRGVEALDEVDREMVARIVDVTYLAGVSRAWSWRIPHRLRAPQDPNTSSRARRDSFG